MAASQAANEMVLLVVETASIQKYIFSSNRLSENIGASYLVAAATGQWAFQALRDAVQSHGGTHNIVEHDNDLRIDDDIRIEQSETEAEVLYAAGGNFVVLFRSVDTARAFTRLLSGRALQDAPGLRMVIHSIPFIWGQDTLKDSLSRVFREIKAKRSVEAGSIPLAGLGVTVMCQSTAMPAVAHVKGNDGDKRAASAEVNAKLNAVDRANDYLRSKIPPPSGHSYPLDLDKLGRTRGESSYIAIVHADGDGIGRIMQSIGSNHDASQVREHIHDLRRFSQHLAAAANHALQDTLQTLQESFVKSKEVAELLGGRYDEKEIYLPFRPLVFGGDDVTFVCDGRIGIGLAIEYLRQFERNAQVWLADDISADTRLTSCAGVAIVKSHFPFARAYELAEDLTKNAKKYRRALDADVACLDWHITPTGIYGDVDEIREREYCVATGSLTLRPVALDTSDIRSWATIAAGLHAFQGNEWQEKRNKAKALREKLREGSNAVQEFERQYNQKLPTIDGFEHGWGKTSPHCAYFDALELMDLYLPLAEGMPDEARP